jgi:hypothetical protein
VQSCLCHSGTPQKSHEPLPEGGGEQNPNPSGGVMVLWYFGRRQNSPRRQVGHTPQGTPEGDSGKGR